MKKRIRLLIMALALVLAMIAAPVSTSMPSVSTAVSAEAATKVKLSKTKLTLTVGKTKTLSLKKGSKKLSGIKWSSSNKKIATVTKAGKITAKKAGTVKIKAKYKGKTYTCKVTVKKKSSGSSMVWISATGSKYHQINNCGRMNPNKAYQETESEALADGYTKCSKCW